MRIEVVRGDITVQEVDAVVNAANTALRPGGGVDGAITRAAGRVALAERERLIAERGDPPLPTGTAVTTCGGDLAARWIIHTAGPVYSGTPRDAELLASCYASSLAEADRVGARSVAFPAISCGIYGYPRAEAAAVALEAVATSHTDVEEVRFVLFDDVTFDIFADALRSQGRW